MFVRVQIFVYFEHENNLFIYLSKKIYFRCFNLSCYSRILLIWHKLKIKIFQEIFYNLGENPCLLVLEKNCPQSESKNSSSGTTFSLNCK